MKQLHAYIDGGCRGNPGLGGWAYVIVDPSIDKVVRTEVGTNTNTTNNRMEMTSLLYLLMYCYDFEDTELTIFSDSQLLINTITKGWKKNSNLDLWGKIDYWITYYANSSKNLKLNYIKVKGHSGNKYNEMADSLLNEAMDKHE